jgi:hypothetical protein
MFQEVLRGIWMWWDVVGIEERLWNVVISVER